MKAALGYPHHSSSHSIDDANEAYRIGLAQWMEVPPRRADWDRAMKVGRTSPRLPTIRQPSCQGVAEQGGLDYRQHHGASESTFNVPWRSARRRIRKGRPQCLAPESERPWFRGAESECRSRASAFRDLSRVLAGPSCGQGICRFRREGDQGEDVGGDEKPQYGRRVVDWRERQLSQRHPASAAMSGTSRAPPDGAWRRWWPRPSGDRQLPARGRERRARRTPGCGRQGTIGTCPRSAVIMAMTDSAGLAADTTPEACKAFAE